MVAALSDWGLGPIVLGVGVYVLGGGLTFPNATALAMQPHPGMAGVAASLLGFVQMACGALASVAVMAFYDGTALAMAAVMAAGAVASLLVHAARERALCHRGRRLRGLRSPVSLPAPPPGPTAPAANRGGRHDPVAAAGEA